LEQVAATDARLCHLRGSSFLCEALVHAAEEEVANRSVEIRIIHDLLEEQEGSVSARRGL
jgi:hypothetical protein